MGVFLGFILFVLFALTGVLCFYMLKKHKKRLSALIYGVLSAAIFIAFIFVPFGFVEVQSGEVAVVRQWGEVKTYKTAGLHFRNIVSQQYVIYDTKIQQMNIEKWCYVKDASGTTQVIQVFSSVQFNLDEVRVTNVATEYGSLEALKLRINTVVLGVLESAAAEYTIDELVTGLGKLEYQNKVRDLLTKVDADGESPESQFYVTFRQIVIEEFVLEPALEEAMLRVRLAEAERKEREEQLKKETAEVEAKAQQDEIKAQTARDIERLNAENDILIKELMAQAKLVEATGEADALIERARGEAEVLRVKSIELARGIGINILVDATTGEERIDSSDPNIGALAEYLEYIAYLEAWDGKLPEVVGDWNILLPLQTEPPPTLPYCPAKERSNLVAPCQKLRIISIRS